MATKSKFHHIWLIFRKKGSGTSEMCTMGSFRMFPHQIRWKTNLWKVSRKSHLEYSHGLLKRFLINPCLIINRIYMVVINLKNWTDWSISGWEVINYTATTFSFEKYQNWHVLAPENYLKIRLCYIVKDRDRLSAKRQVHTGSNERSFAHCCHSLCQSSTVLQEKKIPISLSWNLSEFHGFASFPILVNSSKSPKRARARAWDYTTGFYQRMDYFPWLTAKILKHPALRCPDNVFFWLCALGLGFRYRCCPSIITAEVMAWISLLFWNYNFFIVEKNCFKS